MLLLRAHFRLGSFREYYDSVLDDDSVLIRYRSEALLEEAICPFLLVGKALCLLRGIWYSCAERRGSSSRDEPAEKSLKDDGM